MPMHGRVGTPAAMLRFVLAALCVAAGAWPALAAAGPGAGSPAPDGAGNFEVLGVAFRNRSLGLDRAFMQLGHQCSPKPRAHSSEAGSGPHGRDRAAAAAEAAAPRSAVARYTPNRQWPVEATAGRTALVMAIGGPVQRFMRVMQVSLS